MQTGIYYYYGFLLPMRESLKIIASTGFNNVSFWWGDQFREDYDQPKALFAQLARRAGLNIENIHADYEGINSLWEDKQDSEELVKRYLSDVDDCYNNQIPTMVMHLTTGTNPPMPNELGIERMKRIVERAEQKNINIALENTRKIEHLDFVYKKIKSDRLKFCYDSGHEHCFTKGKNLLDQYGDKLIALHLHDNDGTADQHRIPYEGTIKWNEIALQLKRNHYNGSITIEAANTFSEKYKDLSAEQFLFEAYKKANEISLLCK